MKTLYILKFEMEKAIFGAAAAAKETIPLKF